MTLSDCCAIKRRNPSPETAVTFPTTRPLQLLDTVSRTPLREALPRSAACGSATEARSDPYVQVGVPSSQPRNQVRPALVHIRTRALRVFLKEPFPRCLPLAR